MLLSEYSKLGSPRVAVSSHTRWEEAPPLSNRLIEETFPIVVSTIIKEECVRSQSRGESFALCC